MKAAALLAVLMMAGCNNPPAKAEEPTPKPPNPEVVAARVEIERLKGENQELATKVKELEEVVKKFQRKEAQRKKNRNPTHEECMEINHQFNQCGWKCLNGRTISSCVNECSHFIKGKKGKWCLTVWGPSFG